MQTASVATQSAFGLISSTPGTTGKKDGATSTTESTSLPKAPAQGSSQDKVSISAEGKVAAEKSSASNSPVSLTQQELSELSDLKKRDIEVRTHEQAHLAAAGKYARGGASFTLRKGPDGKSYAVAGNVPIDLSQESNPRETIAKMEAVKRAALAPANPSGADRRIASQATAKEARARQKLMSENIDNDKTHYFTPQANIANGGANPQKDSSKDPTATPIAVRQLSAYSQMAKA